MLVLHGGGGPASVASIVAHVSASHDVIAPTIPRWNGTDRPDWFASIDDVAYRFIDLLRELELHDVTVIGSSIGGWLASAMACLDADRGRISRLCLVDAMGIAAEGQEIRDFFALDAHGVADYSFHDGDRFSIDPAGLTEAQIAAQQQNMATMRVYAGDPYMHDPRLAYRLGRVRIPTLGIWGDSDRIAAPDYGRAYPDLFPQSRFEVVENAGHLPHIEQPAATFALIDPFGSSTDHATTSTTSETKAQR